MDSSILDIVFKIAHKTIGFDLPIVKKNEIGPFLKDLVENATDGGWTTNGSCGLDGTPIVITQIK